MTKALSLDLLERVVAVIDGGLSRRQAAARFEVSVSSAIRWHALAQRTGTATSKRQSGDRRSGRIEAYADMIFGAVAEQSDITLAELRALFAGHGGYLAGEVGRDLSILAAADHLNARVSYLDVLRLLLRFAREFFGCETVCEQEIAMKKTDTPRSIFRMRCGSTIQARRSLR